MFEEKLIAGHDDDDMLSYVVLHEMFFCFMFCRTFDTYFHAFNIVLLGKHQTQ